MDVVPQFVTVEELAIRLDLDSNSAFQRELETLDASLLLPLVCKQDMTIRKVGFR